MLAMDADIATSIGREKILNVKAAGSDGIVTACSFCDIQLTQCQFGEDVDTGEKLPILTLPQLLGAALDIDEEILGFELNRISPDAIMEALQEAK
jgi:heterodisulfide reductase subunit B